MKRSATAAQIAYPDKYEAAKRRRASTQQIVRSELKKQGDLKYADSTGLSQNMTSSGTFISCFNNLTRGTNGVNNFDGNTINPNGYTLKFTAQTTQTYNACRVMVFQWMDASTPALSGVLQYTATGTACVSPILVTNKNYIRVLYDKTFMMAPSASGDTTVLGNGTFSDKVFIPGKRIRKVRYNSSTNVVQDGDIFLLYLSDDSLTAYPQITYVQRCSFYD